MKALFDLLPTTSDGKLLTIRDLAVKEERYEEAKEIKYKIEKRAAVERLQWYISSIN